MELVKYLLNLFRSARKSKSKKILLIDDNKHCTKFNSYIINKFDSNIEITTAINGQDAIEILKKQNFDFVLLDLGLPDISGIDILEIMNFNKYDMSKFIILTVYDQAYMKDACKKLNANSFIEKPLDLDKLLYAIS